MKNLVCSERSLNSIIFDEVTSRSHYIQRLQQPVLPPKFSGITIGIGYDLGMVTRAQFRADWLNAPFAMSANWQVLLESCVGLTSENARKMLPSVRNIRITWEYAYWVFINRSMPRVAARVISIYPNAINLNPDTQGVLMSLVYNRGHALQDSGTTAVREGRRREMRNLQKAVEQADYNRIADLIQQMTRLWDGVPDFVGDVEERVNGLVARRKREADIVRNSVRTYAFNELVKIPLA